jgi:phosphonopyruvate decarboxylase
VIILDGDGALLMKMGTLATIGAQQPHNLHHVCLDNGAHDSTGGQPTVSPQVDLAAVARACGYRRAETVSDPQEFAEVLDTHLAGDGPTFLRMVIKTSARADLGRPRLLPRDGWLRFKAFLESE